MRRVAWVGGLVLVLMSVAAFAGDGIPVGNAVFYPSVEAVYTHTDNLFLQDDSMFGGKVDDSFWILRPSIGFELPLEQSYLKFNLAYQYKEYQDYDIRDHSAWFGELDTKFKFSNGAALYFRDHYVRGVQEVNQFDQNLEATFNNTPFNRNFAQLGFTIPVNKRNIFGFEVSHNMVDFGNADGRAQAFYGYTQLNAGLNWRYNYSAQSAVVAEYTYSDSNQDNNWWNTGLPTINRDYKSHQMMAGWEGAWTARTSGSAKLGYKDMKFSKNPYKDFAGFVGEAGLNFKFTEFLGADLNLYRRASQSAYNSSNFYTTSGGEFQLHHQVTRYFFWSAGVLHQRNKYPQHFVFDLNGDGLYDSPMFLLPMSGQDRRDNINRALAEVGFHFTQQFSMRVNYQYEDRSSNVSFTDVGVVYRPYTYQENRFSFQLQLGW